MHKCPFRRCHLTAALLIRRSKKQHVETFSHCCHKPKQHLLYFTYIWFLLSPDSKPVIEKCGPVLLVEAKLSLVVIFASTDIRVLKRIDQRPWARLTPKISLLLVDLHSWFPWRHQAAIGPSLCSPSFCCAEAILFETDWPSGRFRFRISPSCGKNTEISL